MKTLSQADIDHFLQKGYIKIENAFPRSIAEEWTRTCFQRLGYDMQDKSTWAEQRIHMGGDVFVDVKDFAPCVYDAICELSGGAERVAHPVRWSDHFIVNLGVGAEDPWMPAGPNTPGWHKDGDFFRHFLDSPEQGLLVFVNWTDVVHKGGPTFIAIDSIPIVARFLADRPEGVLPGGFGFKDLIGQCREFEEATGNAGDVFLLHPFMLHAASQNPLRAVRVITNPPVHLNEPMDFNRADGAYSAVEQVILNALGVESHDFKPANERERIVPERVKRQMAMMEAEKVRTTTS
ncbi:MAG TPA: hypothetical protein VK934_12470 [Fimbriimonas sp.]|nr:hypothetical protein [Fimbriimonas sp.]